MVDVLLEVVAERWALIIMKRALAIKPFVRGYVLIHLEQSTGNPFTIRFRKMLACPAH
jgi:hypothetical protein